MDREVIAKKCGLSAYIVPTAVAVAFAIAFAVIGFLQRDTVQVWVYAVGAVAFFTMSVYYAVTIVNIVRTPAELVVWENGVLAFHARSGAVRARAEEIISVEKRHSYARSRTYSYGAVEITLKGGRSVRLKNVAEIIAVQRRLLELKAAAEQSSVADSEK